MGANFNQTTTTRGLVGAQKVGCVHSWIAAILQRRTEQAERAGRHGRGQAPFCPQEDQVTKYPDSGFLEQPQRHWLWQGPGGFHTAHPRGAAVGVPGGQIREDWEGQGGQPSHQGDSFPEDFPLPFFQPFDADIVSFLKSDEGGAFQVPVPVLPRGHRGPGNAKLVCKLLLGIAKPLAQEAEPVTRVLMWIW